MILHTFLSKNVKVEGIERLRVGGMNQDSVAKYFQLLHETFQKLESHNGKPVSGRHILNLDETGYILSKSKA